MSISVQKTCIDHNIHVCLPRVRPKQARIVGVGGPNDSLRGVRCEGRRDCSEGIFRRLGSWRQQGSLRGYKEALQKELPIAPGSLLTSNRKRRGDAEEASFISVLSSRTEAIEELRQNLAEKAAKEEKDRPKKETRKESSGGLEMSDVYNMIVFTLAWCLRSAAFHGPMQAFAFRWEGSSLSADCSFTSWELMIFSSRLGVMG